MTRGGVSVLVVLVVAVVFLLFAYEPPDESFPIEELPERVVASRPHWSNYEEDLKAQLGATAVAQWEGRPVRAQIESSVLHITFVVAGLWTDYDAVLPILIRDHLGTVRQNMGADRYGSEVTYRFGMAASAEESAIPWVELMYPHHERRLVFDSAGAWRAP